MSLVFRKGLMSRDFNEDILEILLDKFSKEFSYEHDVTVQITVEDSLLYTVSVRYEEDEPLIPGFWISRREQVSLLSATRDALNEYDKKHHCQHEHFIRAKSKNGVEFGDGTAECAHCDAWTAPKHFDEITNTQVIDISIQSRNKYGTRYNWGDTFIQGNDYGIVLSAHSPKDNYLTAFFEAFPTIGEHSTFIRGEGATMADAEQEAWDKYQKRMNCDGHEWSRNVHGSDREDGYAICTKCNLTATALEPLTKCRKCGKPANKHSLDGYICEEDYVNFTFEELLEHNVDIQCDIDDIRSSKRTEEEKKRALDTAYFKAYSISIFTYAFRQEYLKQGFSYAEMRRRERRNAGHYFLLLKQEAYDLKALHSFSETPDVNHKDVQSNFEVMKSSMKSFVQQYSKKSDKISLAVLIDGLIKQAGLKAE